MMTQPFDIGCLSTPTGMTNYNLVEYTDESSDDEQLTPGIAVAIDTSSPPNHKVASPIRMPIVTAVSSNVMLNISAAMVIICPIQNHSSGCRLQCLQRVPMKLLKLTHLLFSLYIVILYCKITQEINRVFPVLEKR